MRSPPPGRVEKWERSRPIIAKDDCANARGDSQHVPSEHFDAAGGRLDQPVEVAERHGTSIPSRAARCRQEELRLGAVLAHAPRFQDAVQSFDAAKHPRGGGPSGRLLLRCALPRLGCGSRVTARSDPCRRPAAPISVTAFVDWTAQMHNASVYGNAPPHERAQRTLAQTLRSIGRALSAERPRFRVSFRLYHGWHKGW